MRAQPVMFAAFACTESVLASIPNHCDTIASMSKTNATCGNESAAAGSSQLATPRIIYASFDRFPAPKGAATHIEAFVSALGRQFDHVALLTVPSEATELARRTQVPHRRHLANRNEVVASTLSETNWSTAGVSHHPLGRIGGTVIRSRAAVSFPDATLVAAALCKTTNTPSDLPLPLDFLKAIRSLAKKTYFAASSSMRSTDCRQLSLSTATRAWLTMLSYSASCVTRRTPVFAPRTSC